MANLSQQRKIEEHEGQLRDTENTICEGETTSLSQQRKIEELEAQLQEAEDIVKDLREELREVQAELETVRMKKVNLCGERDTSALEQTSQENGFHCFRSIAFPPPASRPESVTTSDTKNSYVNQKTEAQKCYNLNDHCIGNSNIGKPNLPSKSGENRLDISESIRFPSTESHPESFTAADMKISACNQRDEVYKCHGASECHTGNSYVSRPKLPSIILGSKEPDFYRNRRTQRIHAFEEKLMAGELSFSETVDDVNYKRSGREDGEGEWISKTPTCKTYNNNMRTSEKKDVVQADSSWHQVQKVKSFRRKRKRATRYMKIITPSSRYPANQVLKRDQTFDISRAEANSVNKNGQSGGDSCNMGWRLSADTTDSSTPLKCTKVTESDAAFIKAGWVQNTTDSCQISIGRLLPTRLDSGFAENSGVPICRTDIEKVNVSIVNSDTKTSDIPDGLPSKPVTDRVIKYTFQRKRKKESLSRSDGNANLEKGILKKKIVQEQNVPLHMENCLSIIESSRDSRRLAQVARQVGDQ
ncbi:hypothetical protein U1Q18_007365 [Sarracenia purpurea var. burkii]